MIAPSNFIREGQAAVQRPRPHVMPRHRFRPTDTADGCRICGRPLSFHQQVAGGLCSDWRCKAAQLATEMAAARRQAAREMGIIRPESYTMVVVPDDPARIHIVPAFRHRAHINWLFDLCLRTTEENLPPDSTDGSCGAANIAPPQPLASAICSVCRGTCCHLGGEHAFLDPAAIRAFTDRCGIADPLDIVHTYAARLPRRAVEEGCVYQAESGCVLPRWMRAGICNAYRCQGLRQTEDAMRDHGIQRFFVAVRKDNRIQRVAFVDDDRIRHHAPLQTGVHGPYWPTRGPTSR